jgi:UDP-N-acetylmuramoyl-tripeptide--D-alanyl-D-alanine ligase
VAVLELGMNHPGEIKALSRIAIPSIGAVTNIGPSHIEFLGSLDGVFKAKRELLDSMGAGAVAVLNGDDEFLAAFKSKRLKIVTFGFGRHNDFRAQAARFDGRAWRFLLNGKYPFELNLLGRQNVYNALCAIAVASNFAVGFDGMRDRLSTFRPSGMRLALARVAGVDFINDAYNSNPLSMRWALGAVSDYRTSGRRFVVSGDMLELGKLSRPLHERIGEFVALSGADYLFTMGKFSEYARASAIRHGMDRGRVKGCSDHAAVARLLKRLAKPSDVVLVKGSRAMKMEEVINRFREMM